MEMVAKHLMEAPAIPSTLAAVPAELDWLVLAMLAKQPAERPSLEQVCAVLDRLGPPRLDPGPGPGPGPGSVPKPTGPESAVAITASRPLPVAAVAPHRRSRRVLWIAAGVVVAGGLGIAVTSHRPVRQATDRPPRTGRVIEPRTEPTTERMPAEHVTEPPRTEPPEPSAAPAEPPEPSAAPEPIAAEPSAAPPKPPEPSAAPEPSVTPPKPPEPSAPPPKPPEPSAPPEPSVTPSRTPEPRSGSASSQVEPPVQRAPHPAPRSTPAAPQVGKPRIRDIKLRVAQPTAELRLDGVVIGDAIAHVPLDGRPHHLTISAPGFEPRTLDLDGSTATPLHVQLTPKPPKPLSL